MPHSAGYCRVLQAGADPLASAVRDLSWSGDCSDAFMLRRSFVLAVLLCLPLLASLPARADTNPAPSEGPPSAEGWFGYIDRRTLELPATHWRFEPSTAIEASIRSATDSDSVADVDPKGSFDLRVPPNTRRRKSASPGAGKVEKPPAPRPENTLTPPSGVAKLNISCGHPRAGVAAWISRRASCVAAAIEAQSVAARRSTPAVRSRRAPVRP